MTDRKVLIPFLLSFVGILGDGMAVVHASNPNSDSANFATSIRFGLTMADVGRIEVQQLSNLDVEQGGMEFQQLVYKRYIFRDGSVVIVCFDRDGGNQLDFKVHSVEFVQFDDLAGLIPRDLMDCERAIHQCPRATGSNINSTRLIFGANVLQSAGKQHALSAMRAYLDLAHGDKLDFLKRFRYGIDDRRMIFVGRLTFVRADGTPSIPTPRLGMPTPNIENIARFPLFPLILEDDIPFCIVSQYISYGPPHSVADDLDFYQDWCIVRPRALSPPSSPIQTVTRILAGKNFETIQTASREAASEVRSNLQVEALRAISKFAAQDALNLQRRSKEEQQQYIERMWDRYLLEHRGDNLNWNPSTQSFLSDKTSQGARNE